MNVSDFDFPLPERLIAQEPSPDRDRSRLMVLDRTDGGITHRLFHEITNYLKEGDLLVVNDTKVIPARLTGKKETGGRIELFLLERLTDKGEVWECLVGGKRIRPGLVIDLGGKASAKIEEELGDGYFKVSFQADGGLESVLDEIGDIPLPPYIKRVGARHALPLQSDRERYQTVFAAKSGAVAAPTAGLHFTDSLLERIRVMRVDIAHVTLHVGAGTFLPVKTDRVEDHKMHSERYEISADAAARINNAKREGRRVIAVGTTSVRTLESAAVKSGNVWNVRDGEGRTSIFIYPGYEFKMVDAMVTNFHLPKSTLLMLVSAFAGSENILEAYRVAVEERYRFFSYGDAMMIV